MECDCWFYPERTMFSPLLAENENLVPLLIGFINFLPLEKRKISISNWILHFSYVIIIFNCKTYACIECFMFFYLQYKWPMTNSSIFFLKTSLKCLNIPALGNLLTLKDTLCLPVLDLIIILYINKFTLKCEVNIDLLDFILIFTFIPVIVFYSPRIQIQFRLYEKDFFT